MCYGHSKDHVTKICYGYTSKILSKKICCEDLKDLVTKYMLWKLQILCQKIYAMGTPKTLSQKCYGYPKDYATKICYRQLTDPNCHNRLLRAPQTPCHKRLLWALLRPCHKRYAMGTPKNLSQNICYGHSKGPVTKICYGHSRPCHKRYFTCMGNPKSLSQKICY